MAVRIQYHLVDMLTYAIDTPAPATIILISGDRDFVYAVSVLRFRRYHVVVIAPGAAHAGLKLRASDVLDWDHDVLGKPLQESHPRHASVDVSSGRSSAMDYEAVPATNRRHSFKDSRPQAQSRSTFPLSPAWSTRADVDAPQNTLRVPVPDGLPTTSHRPPTSRIGSTGSNARRYAPAVTVDTQVLHADSALADSKTNTPISPSLNVRL
jgi:hypothetical protein